MTPAHALRVRLAGLLLQSGVRPDRRPGDVAGVVEWFGAMQAQDNGSGLWSLGTRLPHLSEAAVVGALERREALRTWPMRGTVHLVPPRDARWMLDLMGVRALAGAQARRDIIGLSSTDADRAVQILGEALAGGGRLTRAQCVAALADGGIATAGQLAYHLLWYASQQGVTCIAPHVGKEQTFVLLAEWAPDPHTPTRDEGLAIMATRYFRSHGPTTRQDFAGWLGMTAADAKLGIAAAGDALTRVMVDGREMYADPELVAAAGDLDHGVDGVDEVLVLAGFDEYLLGYKDRSLMLADDHKQAIVPGANGVFAWTVVHGGRVVGTWRRKPLRSKTVVDVVPLVPFDDTQRAATERSLQGYARFVGNPVEVRFQGD